jgi:hypothetical protein
MSRVPVYLLFVALSLAQERIRVDVNQAQAPIRVDVNLVNVAFTARDSRGALASDLTKAESINKGINLAGA